MTSRLPQDTGLTITTVSNGMAKEKGAGWSANVSRRRQASQGKIYSYLPVYSTCSTKLTVKAPERHLSFHSHLFQWDLHHPPLQSRTRRRRIRAAMTIPRRVVKTVSHWMAGVPKVITPGVLVERNVLPMTTTRSLLAQPTTARGRRALVPL